MFGFPGPNPVSNIALLVGSTNVTMEFPRPEGRIEHYEISWAEVDNNGDVLPAKTKNMSGLRIEDEKFVKALVEDLMPGVKYNFEIHTISYDLHSDVTRLTSRTCKYLLYILSQTIQNYKYLKHNLYTFFKICFT